MGLAREMEIERAIRVVRVMANVMAVARAWGSMLD